MAVTQYIGARYVPLFADPIDWSISKAYEPLTIVYYQGNSYTSRQYVPTGIEIADQTYWALTGNYNAQIEAYRAEVQAMRSDIDSVETNLDALNDRVDDIAGRVFQVFDTVAAMKADTALKAGAFVKTNGFYTRGDAGAGWYVIGIAAAANEMDVITLDSGLFASLIITDKKIRPEMIGAKSEAGFMCDAHINRALELCNYVEFTLTRYYVSTTIEVPENVTITGISYGVNEIWQTSPNLDLFAVDHRNVTIKNLSLSCDAGTSTTAAGIAERGATGNDHYYHKYENLVITSFGVGIELGDHITWHYEIRFVRSRLCAVGLRMFHCFSTYVYQYYSDRCSTHGLHILGATTVTFEQCNFGIYSDKTVFLAAGANFDANIMFKGCNFEYDTQLATATGAITINYRLGGSVTFDGCRFTINGQNANVHTICASEESPGNLRADLVFMNCLYFPNSGTDHPEAFWNDAFPGGLRWGAISFIGGCQTVPRPNFTGVYHLCVFDREKTSIPSCDTLAHFNQFYLPNAKNGQMFYSELEKNVYVVSDGQAVQMI